jgi:hypothetical protein
MSDVSVCKFGLVSTNEAAQKSGKPAIIHLKVDPEALLPTMSLTATREKAQAGG